MTKFKLMSWIERMDFLHYQINATESPPDATAFMLRILLSVSVMNYLLQLQLYACFQQYRLVLISTLQVVILRKQLFRFFDKPFTFIPSSFLDLFTISIDVIVVNVIGKIDIDNSIFEVDDVGVSKITAVEYFSFYVFLLFKLKIILMLLKRI